jgi:hypothetical protein
VISSPSTNDVKPAGQTTHSASVESAFAAHHFPASHPPVQVNSIQAVVESAALVEVAA